MEGWREGQTCMSVDGVHVCYAWVQALSSVPGSPTALPSHSAMAGSEHSAFQKHLLPHAFACRLPAANGRLHHLCSARCQAGANDEAFNCRQQVRSRLLRAVARSCNSVTLAAGGGAPPRWCTTWNFSRHPVDPPISASATSLSTLDRCMRILLPALPLGSQVGAHPRAPALLPPPTLMHEGSEAVVLSLPRRPGSRTARTDTNSRP